MILFPVFHREKIARALPSRTRLFSAEKRAKDFIVSNACCAGVGSFLVLGHRLEHYGFCKQKAC